jgi:hypothetical protein
MSQTSTPDGRGHREHQPIRQGIPIEPRGRGGPQVVRLVAGSILCVLAVVLVVGGALALWEDRVDRDGAGFVSLGTTQLKTDQYAIVGDLAGDGPDWLYGSTVLGDTRVRATSQADQPLFMGIARTDDVMRYLKGAGYATIYSFEVTGDTTHPGQAPSGPPSDESIWATSTQGSGRLTLRWTPHDGDWSVVFMNADSSANVDVRGDAGAEFPLLPWVAAGLLVLGALSAFTGIRLIVRGRRRESQPSGSMPHPAGQDVSV